MRMKTIYLSPETVHIPFNAVDKIVAAAMYPDVADVSARMFYAVNMERVMTALAKHGGMAESADRDKLFFQPAKA